jgi:hypothetical protein
MSTPNTTRWDSIGLLGLPLYGYRAGPLAYYFRPHERERM